MSARYQWGDQLEGLFPPRSTPCNGCTLCCRNTGVLLYPENGDDPHTYVVEYCAAGIILARKDNGYCYYCNENEGCSIWHRRPLVCRTSDCRVNLVVFGKEGMRKHGVRNDTIEKAEAMLEEHPLEDMEELCRLRSET